MIAHAGAPLRDPALRIAPGGVLLSLGLVRVAVVMPAYNEVRLLVQAFERVWDARLPATCDRRIILVDDGSTDGTTDVLRQLAARNLPGVLVLYHVHNAGKGAALRTGIEAAIRPDGANPPADIVLIHDADLEYDPADHAALVAPIVEGKADAVIGSRYSTSVRHAQPLWHTSANRFLTRLSNLLSNLDLTDMECGLKAFTRAVAQRLALQEQRFGVEPEIVAKVARMKLPAADNSTRRARLVQVGVAYAGRDYSQGKKIGFGDGLAAIWCIVKYNLLSR